ncbi:MAG: hypothetical protein ACI9SJ_001174 [Flavobacteriaceae bacterium]|jgi:hypothetical protein|uniref:head GIN domain-containing protein n=1 Tax=Candidatus Marifrigoribacter sp. Uisw_064 TaxID=3230970 RepID=UPI003ADB8E66
MNNYFFIVVSFLFFGCNSENGLDCFQKTGTIIQTEVEVDVFTRIIVWPGVQLFIQQGAVQQIIIETGENLLNDIEVSVNGTQLSLKNNNECNYVREYDDTKIYVTSPNITEIRNSSSLEIKSIGVLNYQNLNLFSENFGNEDIYHIDGDFDLALDVDELIVTSNGFSSFLLRGNANKATFGLYASNTRIDAGELITRDIQIFHRSSNVMIVNPQESIRGGIVSIGNVISRNIPPIVEVEELYEGRLIFE